MMNEILNKIKLFSTKLDVLINELLCNDDKLFEAARYSVLSGGKRIRAFLAFIIAKSRFVSDKDALLLSAAIELVHCYSLIHDDLPSMDNDDYRRGKSSCHIKFDEATAILAGDALLTYAFEILSSDAINENANIKVKLISVLSQSIGFNGMAGGQMLDLSSHNNIDLELVLKIHLMKTAKLFAASCELGAILSGAGEVICNSFRNFGLNFGMFFQIIDDISDYQSKDDKINVVNIIGVDKAISLAKEYSNKSILYINDDIKEELELIINLCMMPVTHNT